MGRKIEPTQKTIQKSKEFAIKRNNRTRIYLKILAYTPIAKPLNGGGKGSASYLLKLDDESYHYVGNGRSKGLITDKEQLKSIRERDIK